MDAAGFIHAPASLDFGDAASIRGIYSSLPAHFADFVIWIFAFPLFAFDAGGVFALVVFWSPDVVTHGSAFSFRGQPIRWDTEHALVFRTAHTATPHGAFWLRDFHTHTSEPFPDANRHHAGQQTIRESLVWWRFA